MMHALQRLLRAGFMQVEALFNRAFGDKLNPLYHLGATIFLLFWIVGATGLVLYAFFDTSVDGAYLSVQALTSGAWGIGGALRSVHRYASDAMVATMAVHALRYFAFDRLRGFRWFSWVSGVALIWLVYAAGVNGYMLPWDRLAQFVTQASFEWMDWLPGFGGTLIRNFIVPASVSNRLFSLLVFIHIGVPLVALLVMWVHVQRVPKAQTQPPRPIALAVVAMLLVLAVLQPVASQGGAADLAITPTNLQLDWFLLALYPLIYAWPLSMVWALVAAGSVLLLAMPWLPPRRAGRKELHLTMHPGAVPVSARVGETLLEAGLRAGLTLPYDCRAGGCGRCLCTVLNGQIDPGPYQPAALTDAMRANGQALMCCAVALDDVEIEVDVATLGEPGKVDAPPPRRWRSVVQGMERLADDVMGLHLALADGERIAFAAGQYIEIVLDDGQRRAFSFANPPGSNATIELHVRRIPGGRFTTQVFTTMKPGDPIEFEGPLGHFVLRDSDRPILFVAGATGFAPVKSILEDAFARGVQRPMQLYWGVRDARELYASELVRSWEREHAHFNFVPVVSEAAPTDPWPGRRGNVHEAMLADHPDLSGFEVYACGSVQMVQSAVPDFMAHGLGEPYCFTDAFAPARGVPR